MKLGEYADILRSKNAGPYCQTVDFLFHDGDKYQKVKKSNVINAQRVAKLYNVDPDKVRVYAFDSANGIKITMPRRHCSGSWEDCDCYGASQHMPLMDIEFDG